ncbi:MAG: ATP-binding cassette domain-containing protein [Pseudomonadota bacterium]
MIRLVAVTSSSSGSVVLDSVAAEARSGEMLIVEGPRGAGKTTLLEIMGARRRPDAGQVWIADHDIMTLQRGSLPFVRRNIGFVSAAPHFLSGLTVMENVMLPLAARAESFEWAREAALRALGRVGIVGLATREPRELSGSARRLVAVARALAGAPPLLLLDDPSASLAPADIGAVLSALQAAVESGAAVVCAAPDGPFATACARSGARRLRIDAGRVSPGAGPITVVNGGRAAPRLAREVVP